VYWQCTVRHDKGINCPATVTEKQQCFVRGQHHHAHEPFVGVAKAAAVRKTVKDKAKQQVFAPASDLVGEALRNADASTPQVNMPAINKFGNNFVCII